MKGNIQEFLKECGFAPTHEDRMAVMRAFEREADAAIAGAPSSLRMIDSCLSFSSVVPATSAPVVVVDAGGTNLRVAAVRFTADGPVFSHLRRSRMPAPVADAGNGWYRLRRCVPRRDRGGDGRRPRPGAVGRGRRLLLFV